MSSRHLLPFRRTAVVIGALLFVAGCAAPQEDKKPVSSSASAPQAETSAAAQPASVETAPASSVPAAQAPEILGNTVFEPPTVSNMRPTGTVVGQKIESLRTDLLKLQEQLKAENDQLQSLRISARQFAGNYHSLKAAMNARLQVGTTPGNPELVAQWNQAQAELQQVGASIAALNTLASQVSGTASLSAFLLESTSTTFELRGAIEEDHRQLAVLEDEVNKTVVVIDRLLNELSDDIARTQNYFANERLNLTAMQVAIDNGEYIGGSLANRAYGVPAPAPAGGAASQVGARQPLAVIRFDRENPQYEQALFTVIGAALERRPNAAFDIVAVAPAGGDSARVALDTNRSRRNAENVLRTLTNMGLPADRMTLSATSSPTAQVNEVHVYVR
ncbi:hypothetical protein [Pelagibius marinus]|uniref:hypothetical protein n=1 Tax=Pelagibius marinus TaxID=2762760 RepID=UPI00187253D2|nr:hypothetical protein [Pelagibius marinus]